MSNQEIENYGQAVKSIYEDMANLQKKIFALRAYVDDKYELQVCDVANEILINSMLAWRAFDLLLEKDFIKSHRYVSIGD